MNDLCKARTKQGKRCKARAVARDLCAFHGNPGRAAELGRKGGLKRRRSYSSDSPDQGFDIPKTSGQVRDMLADVMARVRFGKMDPKIGSTLAYIGTALLRSVEVSDLEVRVKELERLYAHSESTYTSGAIGCSED